ncbi:hypothetical protein Adt_30047 [Abeliophyllum distichum]|uniref:Uncharacterized protein n=1 Tax=Abeliophyllum distichum TaxID=126358 RepID=A0ABD1RBN5_9LAMI
MSSRSKRHKSSSSVKLVEIVELSGRESDVPDYKVKGVEEMDGDAMGSECEKIKWVGKGESGCEIGPNVTMLGIKMTLLEIKVTNVRMENERENAGVDGQLENNGNANGVPEGVYVP